MLSLVELLSPRQLVVSLWRQLLVVWQEYSALSSYRANFPDGHLEGSRWRVDLEILSPISYCSFINENI